MPDFRVHLDVTSPATAVTTLRLGPDETHHLVNVNRARTGDPVVAFDGRGTEWVCRLEALEGRKSAACAVLRVESTHTRPPLPCRLLLGQGLPKGGTMDDIVRQATELGAARIAPLATARSELRLEAERADKKLEKWRTVAVEAAKQCGNPFLPEITPVTSLAEFLAAPEVAGADLKLVASLHPGARSLRAVLTDWRERRGGITGGVGAGAGDDGSFAPRSVAWLIGPEGDLTADEVAAALAAGWTPVTLGPLVLRCDTAAAFALSVLRCETDSSDPLPGS